MAAAQSRPTRRRRTGTAEVPPAPPGTPTAGATTRAPRLGPATRLLWRSDRCVQLELGPHAVVVDGLAGEDVHALTGRSTAAPRRAATAAYAALLEAGFLWPAAESEDDLRRAPPVPRLQTELTALASRRGDDAAEILHARRDRCVLVVGDGRPASLVASILAAGGIGRVTLAAAGPVRQRHTVPGGVRPADEGRPLTEAGAAAARAAAPEVDTTPLPPAERPDLVVLAQDTPIEDDRRAGLHARECAHLVVRVGPGVGSIGPLVVPGLTACLRCADLHRLDRDPAWHALAVQLSTGRPATTACEVALVTTVAGIAASQALAFLDGEEPASVEGSLELHPPDWQLRRRGWPAHPACDCGR